MTEPDRPDLPPPGYGSEPPPVSGQQPPFYGEPPMPTYGQSPNLPFAPPAPDVRPVLTERPPVLNRSVVVWFVAVGWWLFGLVFDTTTAVEQFNSLSITIRTGPNTPTVAEMQNSVIGVVIVAAAVAVSIWLVLIFRVRAGANWGRVTLTVIAAIGELLLLFTIRGVFGLPHPTWQTLMIGGVALVEFVLVLVAIILMYQQQSNWYFLRQ